MAWGFPFAVLSAALLYLFLIAPRFGARRRMRALMTADYAHRGLHGDCPENSLSALDAAARGGYGVEIDVRLTKDGCIVLSHDDDVSRMCGVKGKISEMTLSQVQSLCLSGTREGIPTLEEALNVLCGRVPVIVEMKSDGRRHRALPTRLSQALKGYRGAYAVESFDPVMLYVYRKLSPATPRGQLAGRQLIPRHRALQYVLSRFLLNFLSRPDFIVWRYDQGSTMSLLLLSRVFCAPLVAWTVDNLTAYHALKGRYDIQIFESFMPDTKTESPARGVQGHRKDE